MLRTISIGSTLHVQGVPVGDTSDGRLMVRVGQTVYVGQPVPRWTDHAACAQHVMGASVDAQYINVS